MNYVTNYINNNIHKLSQLKKIPIFNVGDTLRVNIILEKDSRRYQIFEGQCLAIYNKGIASSFKLKKINKGLVFEKNFPIYSPNVKSIKIIKRGRVNRAKLYYMRHFVGKAARIKNK